MTLNTILPVDRCSSRVLFCGALKGCINLIEGRVASYELRACFRPCASKAFRTVPLSHAHGRDHDHF